MNIANTATLPPDVLAKLQTKPISWIRNVLGYELSPIQEDMARAIRDHKQVAVKSCHSSGKTHLAGSLALWFNYSFPDSLVILTGPTFRQVQENAWKELTKAYLGSKVPLAGKILKTCKLQLGPGWGTLGFATDNPVNFSGFKASNVLIVVDEASGVDEVLFESIEGLRAAGNVRLVLLSQGTQTAGTFFDAFHTLRNFWACITISAFDTPNFAPDVLSEWMGAPVVFPEGTSQKGKAEILQTLYVKHQPPDGFTWPKSYLVNPYWGCELASKQAGGTDLGIDSDAYRVRVLGEFPSGDPNALIALASVDAAINRILNVPASEVWMGLDVARFGDDDSTMFVRRGPNVVMYEERHGQDTTATAGWAADVARRLGVTDINVDTIGVGAGVADQLRGMVSGVRTHDINVGRAASDSERFLNARAEFFWGLRDRFTSGDISLASLDRSTTERLNPELTGIKWHTTPAGKVQIESKDEYKKRLGRSPDSADALMLAFAKPDDELVIFSGNDIDPFFGSWEE